MSKEACNYIEMRGEDLQKSKLYPTNIWDWSILTQMYVLRAHAYKHNGRAEIFPFIIKVLSKRNMYNKS